MTSGSGDFLFQVRNVFRQELAFYGNPKNDLIFKHVKLNRVNTCSASSTLPRDDLVGNDAQLIAFIVLGVVEFQLTRRRRRKRPYRRPCLGRYEERHKNIPVHVPRIFNFIPY